LMEVPMPEYDFVFVLLVFRNTADPEEFLKSIENVGVSFRVVIVNSFYDIATSAAVEKLCIDHACDFIETGNQGYGSGNNAGIAYACSHYTFKYLIVSNPDIVIKQMPSDILELPPSPCIYGPLIKTLKGKRQNPCMIIFSPLRERLMKMFAMNPDNLFPFYFAIAINKAERSLFNLFFGGSAHRVYSLHGSFLIFSFEALRLLGPQPFDPGMFLFREEDHLARLAKRLNVKMIYYPGIRVLHKEDGSVKFIDSSVRTHTVASLRRYFGLDTVPGQEKR
jgi:GT2 family glycosyltransferase